MSAPPASVLGPSSTHLQLPRGEASPPLLPTTQVTSRSTLQKAQGVGSEGEKTRRVSTPAHTHMHTCMHTHAHALVSCCRVTRYPSAEPLYRGYCLSSLEGQEAGSSSGDFQLKVPWSLSSEGLTGPAGPCRSLTWLWAAGSSPRGPLCEAACDVAFLWHLSSGEHVTVLCNLISSNVKSDIPSLLPLATQSTMQEV